MPSRATQDGRVMVENSDKTWATERNGKPLQYSWLENPINSMKRQKDKTLKDELPRSVQFSSVAQSWLTLCGPMDCSRPVLPVNHQLPVLTQTHVHWVSDAIQWSHPLSSSSPPTFNFSQQWGLFQWVSSSHQVGKILELELQYQFFQWTLRTDFL